MQLRQRAVAASLALVLVVTSCGGGTGSAATTSASTPGAAKKSTITAPPSDFADQTGKAAVTITIKDNEFVPAYVLVSPGTKITWDDTGANPHSVTPSDPTSFTGTAELRFGQVYSTTFPKAGDFAYYCMMHGSPRSGQRGGIRVVDAAK